MKGTWFQMKRAAGGDKELSTKHLSFQSMVCQGSEVKRCSLPKFAQKQDIPLKKSYDKDTSTDLVKSRFR